MNDERLEDLLRRLEQERDDADRLYNAALTLVDGALQRIPEIPDPPPAYDEAQITPLNLAWDILPSGPPALDGSLKGRLRGAIWRLVGPALEQQKEFNAALVNHLNRNVASHREAARAMTTTIELLRAHVTELVAFQHHLIGYFQSITLYIDTKDRASAGQAQVLNAAIGALTDDWLKRWESLTAREQRFTARVAALDDLRATVALAQQTSLTLKREVERILSNPSRAIAEDTSSRAEAPTGPSPVQHAAPTAEAAPDLDSFKYLGFEDAFRGSQSEIRARLAGYLPLFEGLSNVLDLGCGRGEFLDLLRERGIAASGLDLNHEMVEVCLARGFDVVEGDALQYLAGLPDASLGGLFAAQVVEHLEPSYLMRLIETAFHKIRPGGVIVLETINAASWAAFFDSYIRDLTHVRPLHPETLQYLLRVSGFQRVDLAYKSPLAEWARLQAVAAPDSDVPARLATLIDTFNENVGKMNARMFNYQDYAAIGHRE